MCMRHVPHGCTHAAARCLASQRHKHVNHARNVLNRAVTLMPRVNQLWYKFVYMEEVLGNVAGVRSLFERWTEWEPEEHVWFSFIKFELRYHEFDRARSVYERFVVIHPEPRHWVRYARFEERNREIVRARQVYERATKFFGESTFTKDLCNLYTSFAKFEEAHREIERARAILVFIRERAPAELALDIVREYTVFEKKHGDRSGIEDAVVSKRRQDYEAEVAADGFNYDAWFDLIRLEEENSGPDRVRDAYERAIANIPPEPEKALWRRYIFLWLMYAMYEEMDARDVARARDVFKTCFKVIPHRTFTFSKVHQAQRVCECCAVLTCGWWPVLVCIRDF
jgi:crooked neck